VYIIPTAIKKDDTRQRLTGLPNLNQSMHKNVKAHAVDQKKDMKKESRGGNQTYSKQLLAELFFVGIVPGGLRLFE
jgi:hypothetical protein